MKGYVKRFNPNKGWGFIVGENGQEVFVHYSEIAGKGWRHLDPGQDVAFEVETLPDGRTRAIMVEVLQTADSGPIK